MVPGKNAHHLRNVSDNPELTKSDFARAKPFAEVFPDLAASIRKGRDADNEARGNKPKPARGR
jgi:hypothetical protein